MMFSTYFYKVFDRISRFLNMRDQFRLIFKFVFKRNKIKKGVSVVSFFCLGALGIK